VHFCGDDHLDADRVVLKAKRDKKKGKGKGKTRPDDASNNGKGSRKSKGGSGRGQGKASSGDAKAEARRLQTKLDTLMVRIETTEARVQEIDEAFCSPDYYETTAADEVRVLEDERSRLQGEVAGLMTEWEQTERSMVSLDRPHRGIS